MVFTLTIFRDLALSSNNNWDTLKTYLTSPEGGKLLVNESECCRYAIIHYDKTSSSMQTSHVKYFRSVVWDIHNMKPLSVAPPAAEPEIQAEDMGNIRVLEEYYDGTNINLYKSNTDAGITTRNCFGAKGKFYSKKTFAELFQEAVAASTDDVKKVLDIQNMAPVQGEFSRFVSTLMKHPEHRVVEKVGAPQVWLLHLGIVCDDGTVIINEEACNIPKLSPPNPGETLQNWFERIGTGRDWQWRGAVLKDGNGRRWNIKNGVYEMIRSIRGNTPRSSERFFGLLAKNMVYSYLHYYPEDMPEFERYKQWTHRITAELFELYKKIYRYKMLNMSDAATYWAIHLKTLHYHYTTVLKTSGKKITKADVIQYINNLPVPRLMFLLRVTTPSGISTPDSAAAAAAPTLAPEPNLATAI
jgi:hypothetical protein